MFWQEIKNIKSTRRDLKSFGLSVGIVLILIGCLFWYSGRKAYLYFILAGAILVLTGLILPSILKPLQKAWMLLAIGLGFIMTRLILALLFFLVMVPIRLVGFVIGHRFLDLKIDKDVSSYWIYRKDKSFKREDCEKQF